MKVVNPTFESTNVVESTLYESSLLFLSSSETGVVENCRKSDGVILETDFALHLPPGAV